MGKILLTEIKPIYTLIAALLLAVIVVPVGFENEIATALSKLAKPSIIATGGETGEKVNA